MSATRREGQRVRLRTESGDVIWVTVLRDRHGMVRLGFDLPLSCQIKRQELLPPGEQYAAAEGKEFLARLASEVPPHEAAD